MALLLVDLGVVKTHSRPHVSTDTPFSEAHFKMLKYCPAFPERFGALEDERAFGRVFFTWYNHEHHHSALGYLTPAMVHYGVAEDVRHQRQAGLARPMRRITERFVRGVPRPAPLPRRSGSTRLRENRDARMPQEGRAGT